MMANEPIPKLIFKMALPTIIAFLITSIYSLADTYFISQIPGDTTNQLAAVQVNSSLDQLIMMCGSLFAIGANSYIARLLGQGNQKKASQVLSTAFFSAFSVGLLFAVFGSIFMVPMVRLFGSTPEAEQHSISYATYILVAAPFMASNFVMNQCLRSEGSATLSMIGIGSGGIINCILDPFFVLAKGDALFGGLIEMPFGLGMGVAGASLATAISKIISFAILIYPYVFRKSVLKLSVRMIHYSKDIIGQIVSVGSSSMFRSGLAVVSSMLLTNLIKMKLFASMESMDPNALQAVIGVGNRIMMFPFSVILGFGSGFQPVAGYNWGAKKYDRVLESYRYASKVAIIGSLVMCGVLMATADGMIGLFAQENEQMQRYGVVCIIMQCIAMPIHAWVAVVNMLCAGLGKAKNALILSTARQGSCFIPILLPMIYFFGANGIASVQAVADILSMALAIPIAISVMKLVKTEMGKNNLLVNE